MEIEFLKCKWPFDCTAEHPADRDQQCNTPSHWAVWSTCPPLIKKLQKEAGGNFGKVFENHIHEQRHIWDEETMNTICVSARLLIESRCSDGSHQIRSTWSCKINVIFSPIALVLFLCVVFFFLLLFCFLGGCLFFLIASGFHNLQHQGRGDYKSGSLVLKVWGGEISLIHQLPLLFSWSKDRSTCVITGTWDLQKICTENFKMQLSEK